MSTAPPSGHASEPRASDAASAAGVRGRLVLVPLPLDFGATPQPLAGTLPLGTLEQAARLQVWICENAKTLRAFLKRVAAMVPMSSALQDIVIHELPPELRKAARRRADAGASALLATWLEAGNNGLDVGLASEAGMPAIADAGVEVVAQAQAMGLKVVALTGPVSMMLALAASGLNGQSFAFSGYLPTDPGQRAQRLRTLDAQASQSGQTQILIETPYRNATMMQALLASLSPRTRLCLASALGGCDAWITTKTVANWRQLALASENIQYKNALEQPCVFLFGP